MSRPAKRRDLLDFVLGFVASAALVGIPVGLFFDWSITLTVSIIVGTGFVGGLYGDRFLHAVADSRWWNAIIGHWWHG